MIARPPRIANRDPPMLRFAALIAVTMVRLGQGSNDIAAAQQPTWNESKRRLRSSARLLSRAFRARRNAIWGHRSPEKTRAGQNHAPCGLFQKWDTGMTAIRISAGIRTR